MKDTAELQAGKEERNWCVATHLVAMFGGPIGVGVVWLLGKEGRPEVDFHGRRALNWQFTMVALMFLLLGAFWAANKMASAKLSSLSDYVQSQEAAKLPVVDSDYQARLQESMSGQKMMDVIVTVFLVLQLGLTLLNLGMLLFNSVRAYGGKRPVYPPSLPLLSLQGR